MTSTTDITIGFVGAGRMAQAIGRGIAGQSRISPSPARFLDPDPKAAELFGQTHPGAVRYVDPELLCTECNFLVLAIKPQVMPAVLGQFSHFVTEKHLVVSVAAGITLDTLAAALETCRISRVMPNTPCLAGQGITAMAFPDDVSREDRDRVGRLFAAVGQTVTVPESQMNAVTGLSGSGPAYVYTFVESLIDAGIAQGLPAEIAAQLAIQTVRGATELLSESGKDAAELRNEVTSPGGTTLAGLEMLQRSGFGEIVSQAVAAATKRAGELSGTA